MTDRPYEKMAREIVAKGVNLGGTEVEWTLYHLADEFLKLLDAGEDVEAAEGTAA